MMMQKHGVSIRLSDDIGVQFIDMQTMQTEFGPSTLETNQETFALHDESDEQIDLMTGISSNDVDAS